MFRWGIIGTSQVARKFLIGLRQSRDGVPVIAYSRDEARRQAFSSGFGIVAASSLQELIEFRVDAIYIATPPSTHRELAIACIAAGKPVLIEKPMAATLHDVKAIVDAARSARVFCMEGNWTRFLPIMARTRHLLMDGAIGEVRSLNGSFGLANRPDVEDSNFNLSAGGGSLLHRGYYPLSIALDLLGPATLAASVATIGTSGVDEDATIVVRHVAGPITTLRASLRTTLTNDLTIEGTHGRIHIAAPVFRPWRLTIMKSSPSSRHTGASRFEKWRESALVQVLQQRLVGLRKSEARGITAYYKGNGYLYEAEAVMNAVRAGHSESPVMTLDHSIGVATLMEAAQAAWDRPKPPGI